MHTLIVQKQYFFIHVDTLPGTRTPAHTQTHTHPHPQTPDSRISHLLLISLCLFPGITVSRISNGLPCAAGCPLRRSAPLGHVRGASVCASSARQSEGVRRATVLQDRTRSRRFGEQLRRCASGRVSFFVCLLLCFVCCLCQVASFVIGRDEALDYLGMLIVVHFVFGTRTTMASVFNCVTACVKVRRRSGPRSRKTNFVSCTWRTRTIRRRIKVSRTSRLE